MRLMVMFFCIYLARKKALHCGKLLQGDFYKGDLNFPRLAGYIGSQSEFIYTLVIYWLGNKRKNIVE